jgi:pyruvate/2-oxoglutarate/acetoin dehydrogenase E1 component
MKMFIESVKKNRRLVIVEEDKECWTKSKNTDETARAFVRLLLEGMSVSRGLPDD